MHRLATLSVVAVVTNGAAIGAHAGGANVTTAGPNSAQLFSTGGVRSSAVGLRGGYLAPTAPGASPGHGLFQSTSPRAAGSASSTWSSAPGVRITETATFTGGRIGVSEKIISSGASERIFGHYAFVDGGISASGRFSLINGVWTFSVNSFDMHAVFSINQSGVMYTRGGSILTSCILCGSTGNIGAFDGLGNASASSGNRNVGLFDGDFNTGPNSGNYNVGVLNGSFNGGAANGNGNIGLLNGNFNGVGYSAASGSGKSNGNNNFGVFNGNFNGDASPFAVSISTQTSQ